MLSLKKSYFLDDESDEASSQHSKLNRVKKPVPNRVILSQFNAIIRCEGFFALLPSIYAVAVAQQNASSIQSSHLLRLLWKVSQRK